MENHETKQALLKLIGGVQAARDALYGGLNTKQRDEMGTLARWSARDHFSHLAFWYGNFARQLDASVKNEKVPLVGNYFNEVNDGIFIRNRERQLEELACEEMTAWRECVEKLSAMGADDLCDPQKFTWLEGHPMVERALGNMGWHPHSHFADYLVKQGQVEKAAELQESFTREIMQFESWRSNAIYNLGCFYALNGMPQKAVACVQEAFGMPDGKRLMEWSKQDTDLDPIRSEAAFKALFG